MLNVIQSSPTGWRCPGCQRCYSPNTAMCSFCPALYQTLPYTNPYPNTYPSTGTPGYLPQLPTVTCGGANGIPINRFNNAV